MSTLTNSCNQKILLNVSIILKRKLLLYSLTFFVLFLYIFSSEIHAQIVVNEIKATQKGTKQLGILYEKLYEAAKKTYKGILSKYERYTCAQRALDFAERSKFVLKFPTQILNEIENVWLSINIFLLIFHTICLFNYLSLSFQIYTFFMVSLITTKLCFLRGISNKLRRFIVVFRLCFSETSRACACLFARNAMESSTTFATDSSTSQKTKTKQRKTSLVPLGFHHYSFFYRIYIFLVCSQHA